MSYTVHVVLQFYRQFDFYTYFVPQEKILFWPHDKSLVRSSWLILFYYILDLNFIVVDKNILKRTWLTSSHLK